MTTPAPGDLRARHVEVLRAIQKFFTFPDDAECKALDAAIAALSALPAAGGEMDGAMAVAVGTPCEKHSGENAPSLDWWLQHTNRCTVCDIEARLESTTPQPSAAEAFTEKHCVDLRGIKVGEVLTAEQWEAVCAFVREQDAIIDAREDAAVGAQGEGDVEFWAERLDMLAEVHGCGSATMKTCADLIRRLAAPAAGKGVDDLLDLATLYGDHSVDSRNRESWDFDVHGLKQLAAALTRQPVAGDGYSFALIEEAWGDTVPLAHSRFDVFRKRLEELRLHYSAPAATPTDGGSDHD